MRFDRDGHAANQRTVLHFQPHYEICKMKDEKSQTNTYTQCGYTMHTISVLKTHFLTFVDWRTPFGLAMAVAVCSWLHLWEPLRDASLPLLRIWPVFRVLSYSLLKMHVPLARVQVSSARFKSHKPNRKREKKNKTIFIHRPSNVRYALSKWLRMKNSCIALYLHHFQTFVIDWLLPLMVW